jgi:hypothetical protein
MVFPIRTFTIAIKSNFKYKQSTNEVLEHTVWEHTPIAIAVNIETITMIDASSFYILNISILMKVILQNSLFR